MFSASLNKKNISFLHFLPFLFPPTLCVLFFEKILHKNVIKKKRDAKTNVRTFPFPVTDPTKHTGHRSLSPMAFSWSECLGCSRMASLSWYSAPHSSRILRVGSPSWKSSARITAPAGSTISFRTLPNNEERFRNSVIIPSQLKDIQLYYLLKDSNGTIFWKEGRKCFI